MYTQARFITIIIITNIVIIILVILFIAIVIIMSPSSSLSLSTLSQKYCRHNKEIQAIGLIYKFRFCCFKQSVADFRFPQHDQYNYPEDDQGLGLEIL